MSIYEKHKFSPEFKKNRHLEGPSKTSLYLMFILKNQIGGIIQIRVTPPPPPSVEIYFE